VYSHSRLATSANSDIDVDVRTGGYVQQRFFAASDHVSSVAVIISRPPVSGQEAFDSRSIGNVRLTMYRANNNAENVESIALKLVSTDSPPDPAGVVLPAGENHKQTVFRLCPVKLTKGQRYAFRVTNEEPDVVLAFSLGTLPGERTSMDIVGTTSGQDRERINYHQVAGYVCSAANC
jgi:hypothetical protein